MTGASKIFLLLFLFMASCVGFMWKLPSAFRGHDKFLHAAFYFCAAAFLHFLFRKRALLILVGLFLFGVAIEWAQEYSNKVTGRRIHGRFDIEDVYANSKGLLLYAGLWLVFMVGKWLLVANKSTSPPVPQEIRSEEKP